MYPLKIFTVLSFSVYAGWGDGCVIALLNIMPNLYA